MLTLFGKPQRLCDGLHRRDFLRAGALGLGGLTLADLLRHEAAAARPTSKKSVIYIVLGGGPSHIDMWDLKPQAPIEYRGPFQPIATRLPGVHICEHMPRQAGIMDRIALIRGIRSVENDHFLSEVYTGLPRTAGKRPAFGSVVSRLGRSRLPSGTSAEGEANTRSRPAVGTYSPLPNYVSLDEPTSEQFEFELPHYAGAGHAPFRPFAESIADLAPVKDLDRLSDRKTLLQAFDDVRRGRHSEDRFAGLDRFQAQALEMITSPQVRDAFDLKKEPEETLRRYGHKAGKYPHQAVKTILYDWDARPFFLARRLVEAGVRVVTLRVGSWDHHSNPQGDIFFALKSLMRVLDQSIVALADDLHDRGLADDVLVVVLGEFGRTPKISPVGPGREHWADAGCALFLGGGLKMGQVIGETDSRAERAKSGSITFQNLIATIYHVLGIDSRATIPDFHGRPQYLLDDPEPVRELTG